MPDSQPKNRRFIKAPTTEVAKARSGISKHGLDLIRSASDMDVILRWQEANPDRFRLDRAGRTTALYLDNTQISDAGLVHLKGLTNLSLLDLTNTSITDTGIADLQKTLPNCRISPRASQT